MVTETRQQFGARVRALRKGEKLSLRMFATMIGISKDYLVDIEYGRKSPTLDTLIKISSGFDMSLSELFEGIGAGTTHGATPNVHYRGVTLQETATLRPTSKKQ